MLRRRFNPQLVTAAIVGSTGAWAEVPTTSTLRDAGTNKNPLVGSAVSHPQLQRPELTSLLSKKASIVVSVRGHNHCWHNQFPAWFKQVATPRNAEDLLRRHITTGAGHYAGRIHSWDVFNEALDVEDGRPDGLRNPIWLQLIGPTYLDELA